MALLRAAARCGGHVVTATEDLAPRRRWAAAAAVVGLFLATAFLRYLSLNGFSNDHYQYLAGAQQMLLGELPTRDFVDPGQPLMYSVSAGAQILLGRTLFAEAAMTALAFGAAAACFALIGWRLSHSLIVGVIASVISVAAFPLPYGYPKVLLYSAVPLAVSIWVRSPSHLRLVAPAVLVAIAFLFRHDHGVYLGLATAGAILLTPPIDRRTRQIRLLVFGGLVVVALVPYLVFIESAQGLWSYALASMRFASREADRTQLHLSMVESGAQAWLFYGVRVLPLVAFAFVWRAQRRGDIDAPVAAMLVISAVLVNWNFLRDPLATRLRDVIVPAVLVGAWLTGLALRTRPVLLRVPAVVLVVLMWSFAAVTVSAVGRAGEQLQRPDLWLGVSEVPRLLRDKTMQLTASYDCRQLPDGRLLPLVPFFDYLDRCTTVRHRLMVTGNAPEIYVYARRPFAAGHSSFIEGYSQSDAEQQQVVALARQQVIAFTIVLSDQYDDWRRGFPELDAFVQARFRPFAEIPVDDERSIRVLVHTSLPPSRVDAATGWPCFTSYDGGT